MQQVIEFARNHPMLVLGWLALLGAVVYSSMQSVFSKVKGVNNHEATQLINREDAIVIDTRTKDEFTKGHISGARHIPQNELQGSKISTIEKYKNTPIIVACESGARSSGAANILVKAGFEQVYNLSGGIAEWRSANLPLVKK